MWDPTTVTCCVCVCVCLLVLCLAWCLVRIMSKAFGPATAENFFPESSVSITFDCILVPPPPPCGVQSFMFEEGTKASLSFPGAMELCFVSIKTGLPLIFRMSTDSVNNATIWCDDMDTVAELVQDLCFKLGVGCVPCCSRGGWGGWGRFARCAWRHCSAVSPEVAPAPSTKG